MLIESGSSLR